MLPSFLVAARDRASAYVALHVLIFLRYQVLLIIVILLFVQVITEENLDVISLSRSADIIILDELLLLADHVLQVNDCTGLEL